MKLNGRVPIGYCDTLIILVRRGVDETASRFGNECNALIRCYHDW